MSTTPKPLDLGPKRPPRAFVRKVGWRWQSWAEVGMLRAEGEYGTYSWTRARAEKKARKLLAWATRETKPAIEVEP
jgi:hypothetical protein